MQKLQPERPDSTTKQPPGSLKKRKSCDAAANPIAVKRDRKIAGNDDKNESIPKPSSSKLTGKQPIYMDHTYRDFSTAPDRDILPEQFPAKFHLLMDFAMRSEEPVKDLKTGKVVLLHEVIYWKPHGRAFVIVEDYKHILESHLLKTFFRSRKFRNFQRQLNAYDFKRLAGDECKLAYYHECFLRSKEFLSALIVRIPRKKNGYKPLSLPELEPKFHEMPYLPDPYSDRTSNQLKPDAITSSDLGKNVTTKTINNCDVPSSCKEPQSKKRILEHSSSNSRRKGIIESQNRSIIHKNVNQWRTTNLNEVMYDLPDSNVVEAKIANHRNTSNEKRNIFMNNTRYFTSNVNTRPNGDITSSTANPTRDEVLEVIREVERHRAARGTANHRDTAEEYVVESMLSNSSRQIIYTTLLRSENQVKYDIEECLARLNSLKGELDLIRRADEATKLHATTSHPSKYDYLSSRQHHHESCQMYSVLNDCSQKLFNKCDINDSI
mmetsp:Transcript_964/g.1262  ORF Transcript_964/g.1262 Transcript_964/m.1262 type:complete len:494 (-) Transcript_964:77-1558(-)